MSNPRPSSESPIDRIRPKVEVGGFKEIAGGRWEAALTITPAVGDEYRVNLLIHPERRTVDLGQTYPHLSESQQGHLRYWAGPTAERLCFDRGLLNWTIEPRA